MHYRALILADQPSEVELVFAWIEHFDRMPELIGRTNTYSIESVVSVLAASASNMTLNGHVRCNGRTSSRSRRHVFAFHEHVDAR